MAQPQERDVRKLLDDAVARGDRSLPGWAKARITRLLREITAEPERSDLVGVIVAAYGRHPGLVADVRSLQDAASKPTTGRAAWAQAPAGRTHMGRKLTEVPRGIRVWYQDAAATVRPPYLVLDDGQQFQTPTPAAQYVNGGTETNGWDAWKVRDGRSLAECYDSKEWPSP